MKRLLALVIFTYLSFDTQAQTIDDYFNKIRNNTAQLTAFFSQMPKGGDLHNHYSGSIYAETYIDYVIQKNYYINTNTLVVAAKPDTSNGWVQFSTLIRNGQMPVYQEKLLQKWSCKDYNGVSYPSDKQFFETFGGFSIASRDRLDTGLLELKRRAKAEHVSYIETMFTGIPCNSLKSIDTSFNHLLLQAEQNRDETVTATLLEKLYNTILEKNAGSCADSFNTNVVAALHNKLHIDDETFTMRYQNYVGRTMPPVNVFESLVLNFISADKSPLIVGVNIVAPENDDISMRDYWLHMQMFKFCHGKFPNVKYSMHAGELALGMVKPEEMSWHINDAVHVAGANRIGHGVDMPYEHDCYDLLRYMAEHKIAIEINLYSNEFILKVKGDKHPFSLYKQFHVPIVICTDDAGVLRSNLIQQYVLLAKRYKDVSYQDIKKYVYNSIKYSFIEESEVKEKLKTGLDRDFENFENKIMDINKDK